MTMFDDRWWQNDTKKMQSQVDDKIFQEDLDKLEEQYKFYINSRLYSLGL